MMLNERIAAAMTHAKLTPAMLVLKTGATKGAVSQWLNGTVKNLKSETALAISQATGINHAWLISGRGSMLDGKQPAELEQPLNRLKIQIEDEIIVNQFDTGGAMGHGVLLRDQPGVIKQMVFNREWLGKNIKHFTNEANLCLVTGFGDSMRGMYNSGDPLIVDKGVTTVEFDGVYFFRVGDEGFIKRLQRVPGQGLIAISENKAYRDWTIDGKMDFEVFGRVLRAWHSEDY
jgi:phage repressor protein C with HTH and peptisase S24 domain